MVVYGSSGAVDFQKQLLDQGRDHAAIAVGSREITTSFVGQNRMKLLEGAEIACEARLIRSRPESVTVSWDFKGRSGWLLGAGMLFASSVMAAGTLQDCRDCSRMVLIRGGSFTMGSPENEPERLKSEGPPRAVTVSAFAIGETEVTRGQYAVFVKETRRQPPAHGCFTRGYSIVEDNAMDPQASWRNPGFQQTDRHPVTCVSWQDAKDYTLWLSHKTGRSYRLPSEAEWEYAARAGTTSIFFWGSDESFARAAEAARSNRGRAAGRASEVEVCPM